MFARLRAELQSPLKSDSPVRPRAFKHRLLVDDDEDDEIRPPSPKKQRQSHYSVAPIFDKYKRFRADEDDQPIDRVRSRRQRPSPSPDPEPPLVTELDERYTNLRATLHSAALAGLEEAEAEMIARSEADIRGNRQKLAGLEAQVNKLIAPLQNLKVDYTATGEDGRERTAAISIHDAVSDFEKKLGVAAAELEGLWAS
ncbi:hypothetical protein F4677DRAFT_461954 [Hypoxylon crocopeplum]|nr:hypothetical protein F4677DRAFT_461954 [Hypoxylon crocopeplum]